jgi:outer membrane biosynthesis protein TonB
VRLTADGEVKVLDFGVARVNLDSREAQTRAAGWIGTERYMSPERILLEGDSAAGDIYAAAATVVELIIREPLGRTPVLEERHTPFVEVGLEKVRAATKGPPAVVDELIDVFRAALATEPEDRPSAIQLRDDFARLARRLEGESLPEFSRRAMPEIQTNLDAKHQPADGVLSEYSGPSMLVQQKRTNATLVNLVEGDQPEPAADNTTRLSGKVVAGGVGVGLVLGMGVVGLLVALIVLIAAFVMDLPGTARPVAPTQAPVTVEPAEPRPVAAPAPVRAPAPAPPPAEEPAPAPQPAPAASPAPAPAPSGPPVSRAQVALRDASSIAVACGTVSATGTASVRIRNFPAGTCTVDVIYLGQSYSTTIRLDSPKGVQCAVSEGAMSCT